MYTQVIMGMVVMVLLGSSQIAVAFDSQEKPEQTQTHIEEERESGFYREDGYPIDTELRPAINPNFAPDESCDLKWELKCIPGSYECWADGYKDGERGEWDTDREHECYVSNIGSIYRQALEEGCLAGGFPEENCLEINH